MKTEMVPGCLIVRHFQSCEDVIACLVLQNLGLCLAHEDSKGFDEGSLLCSGRGGTSFFATHLSDCST
jgi:hypothetical protein